MTSTWAHLRQPEAPVLDVRDLGIISYRDAWDLQRDLVAARTQGLEPNTLLLLEHPHTITCGRRGGRDHILASPEVLGRLGVEVIDVDRGGDVTYHGPGQLVAYPVVQLATLRTGRDIHAYVRGLEQALIDTLANFGIPGSRVEGLTGVWAGVAGAHAKIAALGVKVDGRGVTSHGIALNVTTDLTYFDLIVPCGIAGRGVTSLEEVLGAAPPMEAVKAEFALRFARQFDLSPHARGSNKVGARERFTKVPA